MTERQRVRCPETGGGEDVELERAPLGLVVTGCSRYPDGALAGPRTCVRHLDRCDREAREDRERVLLVLANLHDDAAHIATMLIRELTDDGLVVELADVGNAAAPPVADYDAVLIGAHVCFGHHTRAVVAYIRDHRAELARVPALFFSVGSQAVAHGARDARRLTARTGRRPDGTWAFRDATDLQRTDVRAFARLIADAIPEVMLPLPAEDRAGADDARAGRHAEK